MKSFRDTRVWEFWVVCKGKVITSTENLENALELAKNEAKKRKVEVEIVTYLWSVKSQ